MAVRLAGFALRHPRAVSAMLFCATLLLLAGTPRLRSASYLDGHLPPDDPILADFDRLQAEFGSDRLALLVIGCGEARPCGDVLDPDVLELVARMTDVAVQTAGAVEVASLTRSGVLAGDAATLRVERIAPSASPAERDRFRARLLRDPLIVGTLVSPDLQTTALIVRFDTALSDAERNAAVIRMSDALLALAGTAGFELYATGEVIFGATSDRAVNRDLATLTPLMLLLITGALALIFRSGQATLLSLAVVALPVLWVFGAMGWLGRPLTPTVTMLPILILVVGVTDAVHFLVRLQEQGANGRPGDDTARVLAVAREIGPPTSVTTATSALGFLSFLAGPLPALQQFGAFAAFGIVGAWLTTFTLLPIASTRRRLIASSRPPLFAVGDRALAAAHRSAHGHAGAWVAAFAALTIAAGVGLSRLSVETDGFKIIGEDKPVSRADAFIRERLRGSGSLDVVFRPSGVDGMLDPATLEALAQAEAWLVAQPGVGAGASPATLLRLAHRELVGEDRLPRTREQAAQLLLLAESVAADRVHRLITPDHQLARLSVPLTVAVPDFPRTLEAARAALAPLLDPVGTWHFTGGLMLALHQGDLVLENQIASFTTAFVAVFLVLAWFLRSASLGAFGMIPNLFPVLLVLGFMSFAAIGLDVGTAMIASVVLGVSVDDTVYFLLHYRKARSDGADVRRATAFTLGVAGKPALFSSGLLALGFFVLGFSSFRSLALFGVLAGVAVLAAALTELLALPALLERFVARRERS